MLSKNEQAALSFFLKELKSTAMNEDRITLGWFVDNWNKKHLKQQISDAGGKRIIRHIRDNGLVKRLMADRHGYFVSRSNVEYNRYLSMLERRINRLTSTYKALQRQKRAAR